MCCQFESRGRIGRKSRGQSPFYELIRRCHHAIRGQRGGGTPTLTFPLVRPPPWTDSKIFKKWFDSRSGQRKYDLHSSGNDSSNYSMKLIPYFLYVFGLYRSLGLVSCCEEKHVCPLPPDLYFPIDRRKLTPFQRRQCKNMRICPLQGLNSPPCYRLLACCWNILRRKASYMQCQRWLKKAARMNFPLVAFLKLFISHD